MTPLDQAKERATKTAPASDSPALGAPRVVFPTIKPRGIGCLLITWALATAFVAVVAVHYAQRWGLLR
jgi:hypothetical protein